MPIWGTNPRISFLITHHSLINTGNEVADFVKEHLAAELKNLASFKQGDYDQALKDIYLRIDEMLKTSYGKTKLQSYKKSGNDSSASLFGRGSTEDIAYAAGCTACSAIITPTEIIVGNSGDSRAVLARKGPVVGGKFTAVEMSNDHKPELPEEKSRIERAGGFVEDNRVKGVLNLSRSLGDLEYKSDSSIPLKDQMITAVPEVRREKIGTDASFMIIACDGIWDCLTSQEAVDYAGDLLTNKKREKVSSTIEDMFDKIIATDVASSGGIGCDNMTCVIIQFKQNA